MAPRAVLLTLLAVFAASARVHEEMWGPADGVKALGAVETALVKVLNAKMSPEEKVKATKVAEDVRKAVDEVQNPNSNLTKAERKAVMGNAVKELLSIQSDFKKGLDIAEKKANMQSKMSELKKELADKKKELEKDEAMIKLYSLQKALAEKKLQLQKLIERKNKGAASKSAAEEDAKQEGAIVAKLMNETSSLKKGPLSASLNASLKEVQAQAKKETDAIKQMDADNKKTMSELDAETKKELPTKGKDDALNKGMSMIRRLKKEEHRHYLKARAQKQAQLNELKEVEKSIEQRDATKLKAGLAKINKDLAAQSGTFLH